MSTLTQFLGSSGTAITGYTQTAVLSTSQTVAVPVGTKRIEALLCGGGGGNNTGTNKSGGGFGGLQIFEIPVVGTSIDLIVGAGGTTGNKGGTTSVAIGGVAYGATGGGGAGIELTPVSVAQGAFGGCGGGSGDGTSLSGGRGGVAHPGMLLWSALDYAPQTTNRFGTAGAVVSLPGDGGIGQSGSIGQKGAAGQGSGGALAGAYPPGPGGGGGTGSVASTYGGGGPLNAYGGPMTSVSIWGLTGFAAAASNGSGGGGMLAASTNQHGGNGGGGAGASATAGTGGNGFAVFRFYY